VNFFNDPYNLALAAVAVVSGGALLLPSLRQRGAKVSHLQATQLINQGKAVVIDVREPEEFAGGHLRDAKNIPLKELSKRVGELGKFKSKTAIIVCQNGSRASQAASQLKSAGFAEVYSLDGGLASWQAQGLPVAK
jgi:rhodanese-related sulfurtransferase